jgi:hypothetical protein
MHRHFGVIAPSANLTSYSAIKDIAGVMLRKDRAVLCDVLTAELSRLFALRAQKHVRLLSPHALPSPRQPDLNL